MPIEPMGPVIVGVDGTAVSLAAVDLAADEAAARVTPLMIVHAHNGPASRSTEELLTTAVARVASEHPGLSAAAEFVTGGPAEALLDRHAQRAWWSSGIVGTAPSVACRPGRSPCR